MHDVEVNGLSVCSYVRLYTLINEDPSIRVLDRLDLQRLDSWWQIYIPGRMVGNVNNTRVSSICTVCAYLCMYVQYVDILNEPWMRL